MIGSGKSHIRTVVSIAQAQSLDQEPPPAVKAFASLGTFGRNNANEERDLHRWLQGLHGIQLEVYNVRFSVQAFGPVSIKLSLFPHYSNQGFTCQSETWFNGTFQKSCRSAHAAQVKDSMNIEKVTIPVLLPHEVLHAVWHAGEEQVKCSIIPSNMFVFLWLLWEGYPQ